jgi:FMN-dependent NADH-azoreductase
MKGTTALPKLLHLACSPRADSESAAGARVFLDRFRQIRAQWDIDVMDLWQEVLPEFIGPVLDAKYARMRGRSFTDAQRDGFAAAERIAIRFSLADRVLISTPMWNFSIPYRLKQWFDVIIQPGLTFRFRSVPRLPAAAQRQADRRDRSERQRLCLWHEPRPYRHGDAVPA